MPAQVGDVEKTYANIDHAKQRYGYQPSVSIDEGIKRFVEWFKAQA